MKDTQSSWRPITRRLNWYRPYINEIVKKTFRQLYITNAKMITRCEDYLD